MVDIEALRRAHLNSPQGGLSLPDNWHIDRYDQLKVETFRALLDELEALRAANARYFPPKRWVTVFRKTGEDYLDWGFHISENDIEVTNVAANLNEQGIRQFSTYALGKKIEELSN